MTAAPSSRPGPASVLRALRDFLVGMFTRNLPVKIAALVLAVLVFYTVRKGIDEPFESEDTIVRVELEKGLMLIGPPPPPVKIRFEGPASQIANIARQDQREIRLKVRKSNLQQLSTTLTFSPDRGNVSHPYGRDIRITAMDPGNIELDVAFRGERLVPVNKPRVELTLSEWKYEPLDLLSTEVEVTGPQVVLENLTSVTPAPVDADRILKGVTGERFGPIDRVLALPAELRERHVELSPGQEIRVRLAFVRSGKERELDVPFAVYFSRVDAPISLVVNDSPGLKPAESGDGYLLTVTFTGTSRNLDLLEEAIEEGRVRAYVRAEDFAPYAKGEAGLGSTSSVNIELPQELWEKVSYKPPNPQGIILETKPRED